MGHERKNSFSNDTIVPAFQGLTPNPRKLFGGAQVTILSVNMRRMLRLALAVLLMCPAAYAAPQAARQPEKASVEGVVVRSGSGEPLSRVQVTLRRIPDQQENEIPRLLTQDNGKFSFENLEPGQFELTVARNGYARQVYGQGIAGGRGHLITLAEGQALKGITFRMVQGGVISGRVRDFRGEAVAGYQVFLMKSEYTADGKRRLTDAAGTVTDDRGEYRLYWIPPGHYYLLASQFLKGKKDGLGPDVVPDQVFPTTYYPGVADLPRAVTIEIRPGAELGAMDIVLPQPAAYRIRGRVIDGSTGRPPPQVEMVFSPRSITGAVVDDRKDYSTRYDSATGGFEVRNVVPGEYWLGAFMFAGRGESLASAEPPTLGAIIGAKMLALMSLPSAAGQVPVNIVTSDSNDVVLTLGRGVTVPVRLQIEGDPRLSFVTSMKSKSYSCPPQATLRRPAPRKSNPMVRRRLPACCPETTALSFISLKAWPSTPVECFTNARTS